MKYITIDITTLAGIKKAERYHRNGWKIVRNGMFSIQFSKAQRPRNGG